ncbi:hypothetical protein GCM10009682_07140 [Luedemannella flava]|uniref:Uncharacterized protein n=1 Tax=Luedemannella flava TaxID=349316 RepID=A0ABP4XPW0_9ACTN
MATRNMVRAAVAALVLATLASCGGETPPPANNNGGAASDAPIGILKSATDGLVVFIGNQCADAAYPTRVTVNNVDQASRNQKDPAVWDISTSEPNLLASLVIGKLPYGFNEVSNQIKDQGVGPVVRVQVVANGAQAGIFDTAKVADGQLIDARGSITTVDEFRKRWGCGGK